MSFGILSLSFINPHKGRYAHNATPQSCASEGGEKVMVVLSQQKIMYMCMQNNVSD